MNKTTIDGLVKIVTEQTVFPLPASEWQLMRLRGIGPQAIEILDSLGYVKRHIDPFPGLSVRAGNTLSNIGVKTKEDARLLIETGRLAPGKRRNYGDKTHREVCEWAGVKLQPPPPKKIRTCPHCGKRL